jgi:uncharacterized protein (DUF1499 family)
MTYHLGDIQRMGKTLRVKFTLIAGVLLTTSSCAITQHTDPTNMKCPDAPKCVSSEEPNSSHFIEPLTFTDQPDQVMARLKVAVLSEENITITKEEPTSLYAEVRSQLFGFVDDMKFVLVPTQGKVQVRSSARTGYSDFGVNRRRVERIRSVFNENGQ